MNIRKMLGIPTDGPAKELRNYTMTPEETARRDEMWSRLKSDSRKTDFKLPCREKDVLFRDGEGYYCLTGMDFLCQSADFEEFRWQVLKAAALKTADSLDNTPEPGDAVAWTTAEFSGTANLRKKLDPKNRRKRLCSVYELILKRSALIIKGQPLRDFTAELEEKLNAETSGPEMYFCVDKLKFVEKE